MVGGSAGRSILVLLASAIAAAIPIFIWRTTRTKLGVEEQARSYVGALRRADADMLANWISERDLKEIGMTQAQAHRLVRDLIAPKCQKSDILASVETRVQSGGASGVAFYKARSPRGRIVEMAVVMELENGRASRSLKQLLYDAWLFEYLEQVNPISMERVTSQAIRWGLERDLATLRGLGVTKMPQERHGLPPRSLDETLMRATKAANGEPF